MSKAALYGLIAAGLMLGAALVNHAVPRLETSPLALVPIERLPRRIGGWRNREDEPIDAQARRVLPQARMLARRYRDPGGRQVELFLETSPEAGEYHPPTVCIPAQGWNVTLSRPARVDGPANGPSCMNLHAQLGTRRVSLLYWYTSDRQFDKWQALKARLSAGRPPTRLFVRLLVMADEGYEAADRTARAFGRDLLPALAALENAAPAQNAGMETDRSRL